MQGERGKREEAKVTHSVGDGALVSLVVKIVRVFLTFLIARRIGGGLLALSDVSGSGVCLCACDASHCGVVGVCDGWW